MDGDMMIGRGTGEVLGPQDDSTYWKKQILRVDFIVFVVHKITYRKADELHVLNGTDTLDT